ncbi:methyltransferase family protein [Desulfobulbus propionicus]|jgi:protein-S-isoprenylcysteine O-methyltransferase Ste14
MLKLVLLWGGWCALHSLLITSTVRRWIEGKGGRWLGLYRLIYIGVAIGTLVPVLWYTAALPQQPLGATPLWLRGLQGLLLVYSLIMFVGGMRVYDLQTFLGLRQWRHYRQGATSPPPVLNTSGILRSLRHPWYSGGIALLWGLPILTDITLVTRSILTVYLVLGAFLEERKMREALGEPYRAYCRETPMFVPWRFGRRNQR